MSRIEVVARSASLRTVVTVASGPVFKHLFASLAVLGVFACSSQGDGGSSGGSGGSVTGGSANGGATAASGGVQSGGASSGGASSGGASATGGTPAGGASSGGASAGGGGTSGAAGGGSAGVGGYVPSGPCSPPVDIKNPVAKLSDTGCMSTDLRKMADVVIPYDVNSPLWSDSSNKTRGLAIPPGTKIHVLNCSANPDECRYGPEDDGHWVFPVGTVLVKNFQFDDKFVETRLFVRRDTKTWVGYSYQWDEAQTDATIVGEQGASVNFNTGKRQVAWSYPSRYDCMLCHNKQGGYSIGPETRQLNKMVNGENVLDKLERVGAFDAPLTKLPALPTPYDSFEGKPPAGATTEELARSYLHANCAFCHRADGNPGTLDLRWGVSVANTAACNVTPQKGGAGLSTYTILTPGKPEESVLWARMNTLDDKNRMPQIGTYVVDQPGVKLVGDWITSIKDCK